MADMESRTAPGVRSDVGYQVMSYRYLRMGIIGLLLTLGAAVIYERVQPNCSLGSVSAYYYTPARSVFVAGLVGLGVCMLALRGMNLGEDIFLNIGGIFAFLVAFVPTPGGTAPCQDPDTRVSVSAPQNVTSLLIVGFLGIMVASALLAAGWKGRPKANRWWALMELIVALALWAATLIAINVYRSWALSNLHNIAAISLAACIIAVAGANAYRPKQPQELDSTPKPSTLTAPARPLYAWISGGMLVISIIMLVLSATGVISVFWLELAVAIMFIIFWAAQTVQLELESAGQAADGRLRLRPGPSSP